MGKASRHKTERRHANHRCIRCGALHDWYTSLVCRRCRAAAIERARTRRGACYDPAYDRRMLALLLADSELDA